MERDHTVLCTRELTQKELQQFRKVRGSMLIQHVNSLTPWHIRPAVLWKQSRIMVHHQAAA